MFKLGLNIASYVWPDVSADRMLQRLVDLAKAAERSGFDAIFVQDHLRNAPWIGEPTDPVLECSVVLAMVAAHTQRALVGSYVTPVAFRHPSLLARQTSTLDVLSGGRAILGLGSGGFADEHLAYGFEFGPDRWDRLEESVEICKLMFSQQVTSYAGQYYHLQDAHNVPQPLRVGGPPVLIAGVGKRKLLPIVARRADIANVVGNLATVEQLFTTLDAECVKIGREPSSLLHTYGAVSVVGASDSDARARAQAWTLADLSAGNAAGGTLARDDLQSLIGGPDTVQAQVARLRKVGVESLIVSLGSVTQHPDDVAEMGSVLSQAMAD